MISKRSPTSHSYFSKRLRLHYLDWGNQEAPPLLMVHGNRDHCHNWDWMAERLADEYHIVAPDLRGHGDSQWNQGSSYSVSEYVYDVAQLVRQAGIAPVRIVAHSLGASVAMQFSGVFPDDVVRLVCLEGGNPAARPRPPLPERLRNWVEESREISRRQPRRYQSLEDALARMQEANPHLSPEQARHLTIHGINQNEDGSYTWKFDPYVRTHDANDFGRDLSSLVAEIRCPVLMISGAESWVSRTKPDLDAFRDVRLEIVHDAGHWVHHDQLDIVTDFVTDFLR